MLLTLEVNADTAEAARSQAIAQAEAMGYSRISGVRVLPQSAPDVGDAFATGAALRSYRVQLDAVR